jgi:outer membrane protein TolC
MMNRFIQLSLAFSFLFSMAAAQSVDSLVHEALRNNSQVKAFEYQRNAADNRAHASSALPPPTLGIEFSQVPISNGNVVNGAVSNNVSLSQMFMLGGKLSAMSEVERRRGAVIGQNGVSFQAQLRAKVKLTYYQLWLLDRQIEVRHRTLTLLGDLVQSMEPHVVTNRMRQADLLSIQAEAASERARLKEQLSRRIGLVSGLNALLARDDLSMPIITENSLPVDAPRSSESILAERITIANPSLVAMDRMKEMNEAMIRSAQKDLIPDVMIQGMIMRMPNGMILTGGTRSAEAIQQSAQGMPMQKTDWMYSIMASITLPFMPWSSARSSAKVDEMRVTNLSIDAEREAMQREMTASLRSAMATFTTADSLVRQYETEILPLTKQSAQAQTIAYQNGQVPITTVLDARRMELMKQDDYLMVLMERQMALVEMELMVGSPILDNK